MGYKVEKGQWEDGSTPELPNISSRTDKIDARGAEMDLEITKQDLDNGKSKLLMMCYYPYGNHRRPVFEDTIATKDIENTIDDKTKEYFKD